MLCYVMLCYVMLCYVMLCYVMLCYVMLCYVMGIHKVEGSRAKIDGRQDENGDGSLGAKMTQHRPPKTGGEERWTLYESEKTEYKSPQDQ